MNKVIVGVCTLIEVGCIASLAAIGLKRNNDCYKAEVELGKAHMQLLESELQNVAKDCEIIDLKKQIKRLQGGES